MRPLKSDMQCMLYLPGNSGTGGLFTKKHFLYSVPCALSKNTLFYIILITLSCMLLGSFRCEASGSSKCTVYFYNPESNVDNFASLKTRLDIYLKNLGPYQFQPFCDRNTFETTIRGKHDCIFILSSWHYKELKKFFPMKPVMVSTAGGKPIQKKILSAKNTVNNPRMLKGAAIASSGSEEYTRKLLASMLGKDNAWLVDTFQILSVPKDIDALISIGFGLVQAALTTEYSVSMLPSINQRLCKKLTVLAKSEESLLPIVAIPEVHDPEVSKLLEIVENMGRTTEGKNCIQMFGLDGWKKLDEKDWELLRK